MLSAQPRITPMHTTSAGSQAPSKRMRSQPVQAYRLGDAPLTPTEQPTEHTQLDQRVTASPTHCKRAHATLPTG